MKQAIIIPLLLIIAVNSPAQTVRCLVGTTDDKLQSIAICDLDEGTGKLKLTGKCYAGFGSGYLTISSDKKFLYCVSTEKFKGDNTSSQIKAFQIMDGGNSLQPLNQQSSMGQDPCHISITTNNKFVLIANYGSGNAAVYPVSSVGSLSPSSGFVQHTGKGSNSARQEGPHAHYITTSANGKFAFIADLGIDKIMIYELTAKGELNPSKEQPYLQMAAGAGPRHLVIHPNNKQIFIANELNSTVVACDYDAKIGKLTITDTQSALPDGFTGNNTCAAIRVHPNGKFLYCSNRGQNSIAVFAIEENGKLKKIQNFGEGLGIVRDFNITPSGKYILAGNLNLNNIKLLKVNDDGTLAATSETVEFNQPSCFVYY